MQRAGSTQYSFYLSALNILVSMYTRQKDIVVGTLVEGRNHHELHHLIGLFVNTLPMRNTVNQEQTFLGFMQAVQQKAMKAFAYSDVPFERMVELSGVRTEKGRNPLFDVMFSYQDFDSLKLSAGEAVFQYEELWTDDSKFDIEFEVVNNGSDCHSIIQYAGRVICAGYHSSAN